MWRNRLESVSNLVHLHPWFNAQIPFCLHRASLLPSVRFPTNEISCWLRIEHFLTPCQLDIRWISSMALRSGPREAPTRRRRTRITKHINYINGGIWSVRCQSQDRSPTPRGHRARQKLWYALKWQVRSTRVCLCNWQRRNKSRTLASS